MRVNGFINGGFLFGTYFEVSAIHESSSTGMSCLVLSSPLRIKLNVTQPDVLALLKRVLNKYSTNAGSDTVGISWNFWSCGVRRTFLIPKITSLRIRLLISSSCLGKPSTWHYIASIIHTARRLAYLWGQYLITTCALHFSVAVFPKVLWNPLSFRDKVS